MNITELKAKTSKSFSCRYKLLKDINLKYKLNIEVFLSFVYDKFILNFKKFRDNYDYSLEYRHRKFSYLRSLECKVVSNDTEDDLIELYFDSKEEENRFISVLDNKKYIAYIENYNDNFLFLVVNEYDDISLKNLTFYYNSTTSFNKDFTYNSLVYDSLYLVIASNDRENYLIGRDKYLEFQYKDNVLIIEDNNVITKVLNHNNYKFTLYSAKHSFCKIDNNTKFRVETKIITSSMDKFLDIWDKYGETSIDFVIESFYKAKYLKYCALDTKKDHFIFTLTNDGDLDNFIEHTSNINASSLYFSEENIYNKIISDLKSESSLKKEKFKSIDALSFISSQYNIYKRDNKIFSLEYTKKLKSNDTRLFLYKDDKVYEFDKVDKDIKLKTGEGYIFYLPNF